MKIYQIFEGLIREEEINGQAEKCVKLFGHELFGPQLGGGEENTDYENNVLDDIENFTHIRHGERIDGSFIKAIKNLKSCMSTYPEVLYPEGTVYRGTHKTLREFLNMDYTPKKWNKMDYVGKTLIQSWTEDFEVADDFAVNQINAYTIKRINYILGVDDIDVKELIEEETKIFDGFKVPFILEHKATPDQFLFKAKYFNLLSQAGQTDEEFAESEVLRVDNRSIIVNGIIPSSWENKILAVIDKIKKVI